MSFHYEFNGENVFQSDGAKWAISTDNEWIEIKKKSVESSKLTCVVANIIVDIEIADVETFEHVWIPFFTIVWIE